MVASMGHQSAMSINGTNVAFVSETLKKTTVHVEPQGIRGTRSMISENVREGLIAIAGQIVMEPNPDELDVILPLIMGGGSNPTFTLAETLSTFDIIVDRVAQVHTYSTCKVNKATFTSSKGQVLQVTLDIVGTSESIAGSPGAPASTLQPYMLHDSASAVTISGSARSADNINIVIDNQLITDRYFNSQTLTEIPEGGREISFSCTIPYTSSETGLHDQALSSAAAATIVFTNGAYSVTFSLAKLQIPANSPTVPGRGGEILLEIAGISRKSSSTEPLVVTNDSTP